MDHCLDTKITPHDFPIFNILLAGSQLSGSGFKLNPCHVVCNLPRLRSEFESQPDLK